MSDKLSALTLRDTMTALESVMLKKYPDAEKFAKELPVDHCFSPGLYGRALHIPAGTTLTGRIHKGPCLNIILEGSIIVRLDDGSGQRIRAPFIFMSKAGSKKAGFAISDTIWMTVHPNPDDVTDPERMEDLYTLGTFEEYDALVASEHGAIKENNT